MCHELVHAGKAPVPNILENLFCWAAGQPEGNIKSVQIVITSNQIIPTNIVSYAQGSLIYVPGYSVEVFHCPPSFASEIGGIKQYFSDRLYGAKAPFNWNDTDSLTVYISRQGIAATSYAITIKSSRYGLIECFAPNFDTGSNVMSGTIDEGRVFLTVSLYNPVSQMPSGDRAVPGTSEQQTVVNPAAPGAGYPRSER